MILFCLGFVLCWAVQGGLSSPLLPLGPDYGEIAATQSMSPGTWASLSKGISQPLGTLENRGEYYWFSSLLLCARGGGGRLLASVPSSEPTFGPNKTLGYWNLICTSQ